MLLLAETPALLTRLAGVEVNRGGPLRENRLCLFLRESERAISRRLSRTRWLILR